VTAFENSQQHNTLASQQMGICPKP